MPGYPSSINLDDIDETTGARIKGSAPQDQVGLATGAAGDVNGDGFADFLVTGERADVKVNYVVFGSAAGLPAGFTIDDIDGSNGFLIEGRALEDFGTAKAAGDVNGDGFADIFVTTADYTDPDRAILNSHVIFGAADGLGATVSLDDLDGSNGFTIAGSPRRDLWDESAGPAGDVNGDGFADITVKSNGEIRIFSGAASGLPAETAAADLPIQFQTESYFSSGAVPLGDLDADGYEDVVINGTVVFGSAAGLDATRTTDLTGLRISAADAAGDVNGDGYADFIVGASGQEAHGHPEAGEAYVIFGTADGLPATLDVTALDGSNGFAIRGETLWHLGGEAAGAGDVNGDGFDDVIVGTSGNRSYVVFGRATYHTPGFDAADLDGANGFRLASESFFDFYSPGGGGDFNGDGFSDLILGYAQADPDGISNAGEAIVVHGLAPTSPVTRIDGSGDQTVRGGASDDVLISYGGNDRLVGGEGNDSLRSALGTDVLDGGLGDDEYFVLDDHSDTIIDAGGTDTVRATASWSLEAHPEIENLVLANAGDFNLTGNALGNRITGGAGDNVLKGLAGDDRLEGGLGDDILSGGQGRDILIGGGGADRFDFADGDGTYPPDTIVDFVSGEDLINLGAIDANWGRGGNQAFSFIGESEFSGAGAEVRVFEQTYTNGDVVTIVEGSTNGGYDFQIALRGAQALSAADFIL